ncbi:hypothetical protein FG09884.1 [Paecilomyces variotii No. 5]|uniref:Zn(2)-C6 fungal-type domain-containing protein n=1 Tax=Byssochlamys spectabilis (strain No. 5 / NBRC 109023) TaxID=1356009 RepID=V5FFW2_BYSSN|nr:hypothetical protein FG09884.1 [Paecilomyces variotii No. 5]
MSASPQDRTGADDDDVHLPPNKRARILSKACENCRVRKSRCDSSRPHCDPCQKKGITCVYKEKGQPGIRPGYGKAMEGRLSTLETNMTKMSESMQEILALVKDSAITANVSVGPGDTGMSSYRPTNESQSIMNAPLWPTNPCQDMSGLSQDPITEPMNPPLGKMRSDTLEGVLPPRAIMEELVQLFFEMIHPWCPLFHRPTFMAQMTLPERQILLHAIVVVTFRFWDKELSQAETRESYVKTSRDFLLLKTVGTCTLVSTQALALAALDALGEGTGPKTWNILSMLVCNARHLSLARRNDSTYASTNTQLVRNEDFDDEMDITNIEAEERTRLFWVIYSLDRLSSISHGQSGGIDTKSIRVAYPVGNEHWGQVSTPEWFQPVPPVSPTHRGCSNRLWHYQIDLLALVDRSNQLLIQPMSFSIPAHCQEWQNSFRRIDTMLTNWLQNLPQEDREEPGFFSPMWITLHTTFHLIRIRLYTVAAFPSTTSPYLRPSVAARGRCRQVISEITSLVKNLKTSDLDRLGPMFAFVVWVASRSLIILWTTGYEAAKELLPPDLEILLNILRQLSMRWPCAQKYTEIIQLVLERKDSSGGATILDIFNDTRRTSYGLQNRLKPASAPSLTDFSPHSFDFLDVPGLDMDLTAPWDGPNLSTALGGDWL